MLKIYNTQTRKKEQFIPLEDNVRMYVCGPTVYDEIHIGNARPLIVFDVLYRLLRQTYNVTYVRNITDIDDKIINVAKQNNETITDLTERTIASFKEITTNLNVLSPTYEPRATEYLQEMITMIETLVSKDHAYVSNDHVYFDCTTKIAYGLTNTENLNAGTRIEISDNKKHAEDFVLWKPDENGWDSPWGAGRPGWHIECSAMAGSLLGKTFDIHGGGLDLIFPHHENEIAQSTCVHGVNKLAQYWMHNGFVTINKQKMAKSTGNFITVRSLLEQNSNDVIRIAMLSTHYRQPFDWNDRVVSLAKDKLKKIKSAIKVKNTTSPHKDVVSALEDDLNTPLAIDLLMKMIKSGDTDQLYSSARFLGLTLEDENVIDIEKIDDIIAKRNLAREHNDYALADQLRNDLLCDGITLEDTKDGTIWKYNN